MYKRIIFNGDFDIAWKDARRFYDAARRRDWWVSKDGRSVYLTDVPQDDVTAVLNTLNIHNVTIS